ncbi:MAG: hypothetical protein AAF570_04205 [Bacteroidota bacterium]
MNHVLHQITAFLIILIVGEILVHLLFQQKLNPRFGVPKAKRGDAQLKGHLERFLLYLSFVNNLAPVVIALGTLKIGTRLTADKDDKVKNDFFLIGNVISITFAVLYFLATPYVVSLLDQYFST